MTRRYEIRGRRNVRIVVDERRAEALNRAVVEGEPAPEFWDRFDDACDRFIDFVSTKVFWIIGALCGALIAVAVAGQLLGWTSS